MRLLFVMAVSAVSAFGCFCTNTASPCSGMAGSTVVFVASVTIDSGEGWGTRHAHVVVEEALYNVPKDLKEADIDVDHGTSCYRRLKAGERYVIFADRDEK